MATELDQNIADLRLALRNTRDLQLSVSGDIESLLSKVELLQLPDNGSATLQSKVLLVDHWYQKGQNADKWHNDCGPTTVKIVGEAYIDGFPFTIDELYDMTGHKVDEYTSVGDLRALLYQWGITTEYYYQPDVVSWINSDLVIIALHSYEPFADENPDSGFLGMHFSVIAGYRYTEDGLLEFWLLDPLWKAGGRWVAEAQMNKAWTVGEYTNRAIVTQIPLGTKFEEMEYARVLWPRGLNVRYGPGLHYNIVGSATYNKSYQVYEWAVDGSDLWARIGHNRWFAVEVNGTIYSKKV